MNKSNRAKFQQLVANSQTILILQPEKPDTDSLGSSLALENILGALGKTPIMYCQDDIPEYIRVLDGWDRVVPDFPAQFDFTILVDAGGPQAVARTFEKHGRQLAAKPFVILDHHASRADLAIPTIDIIDPKCASTTQLVVNLATEFNWAINLEAAQSIVQGIMADTRGLTTPITDLKVIQTVADMVKLGVSLPELHQRFRAMNVLAPELLAYKAKLIERIEYFLDGALAVVVITPEELTQFAKIHDPGDLVIYEMVNVRGVALAAVLRNYGDKLKGSTRANRPLADEVCRHFGGGGHPQAAGFRVDGRPVEDIKKELIEVTAGKLKGNEPN